MNRKLLFLSFAAFLCLNTNCLAQSLINFQAELDTLKGSQVDILFQLYDSPDSNTPLANDEHLNIEVSETGFFRAFLSFPDSLFTSGMPLYLQMQVNNQVLEERYPITSVPLAVHSQSVSKLPPPDFDSGWFEMQSQADTMSYRQVWHNLGKYPTQVKVLVRGIGGPNKGFIFEGGGVAFEDDDGGNAAGVVFAYDQNRVRIWAPTMHNNLDPETGTLVRIVGLGDGWGGGDK